NAPTSRARRLAPSPAAPACINTASLAFQPPRLTIVRAQAQSDPELLPSQLAQTTPTAPTTQGARPSVHLVHIHAGQLRGQENPASSGAFQCAREDSNLHGPNGPQGPQPPPCWTLADATDSFARCKADSWTGWTLLDGMEVVTGLSRSGAVRANAMGAR